MTPRQFAKIALSFPETVESEHMGHPDFRVGGKIFASLSDADGKFGMVKLNPTQQAAYLETDSDIFQPCNGAWGKAGCTYILLASANATIARSTLELAYENVIDSQPKRSNSKTKPSTRKTK